MSEKEDKKVEELKEVMDMNAVRENENTALGRSSVGQIGREAATRSAEDVVRADAANEEITNSMDEKGKTIDDKGLEDK
mgnify:CR=1 FL=1